MYLTFDVFQTDVYFKIRVSDHSKIDGENDDAIYDYGSDIEMNIFSSEKKAEVLEYLKKYFQNIPKINQQQIKNVFVNKVEKRVVKSKHSDKVLLLLKKLKIKNTLTNKQIQAEILKYLVSKKTPVILTKKEYDYVKGSWRYKGETKIEGNLQNISSTGGQVTVNGNTGKDFVFKNDKDQYLVKIATSAFSMWDYFVDLYNKSK